VAIAVSEQRGTDFQNVLTVESPHNYPLRAHNRRAKLGPKRGPNDIFGWDQVRQFGREEVETP
jgi:hypothetical protein